MVTRDSWASRLVGPKPKGHVRTVSLAVKRYLQEFQPEGLIVAVSGGADSLALAVATTDLALREGIAVSAVVVDHGIRPESAEEARGVAALLQRLGVDEVVVARPAHSREAEGPEGQARSRRHAELRQQATNFRTRHNLRHVDVLLGHTLDDQAETVLLGLARGSGAGSIQGMRTRDAAPESGTWVGRPLLDLRRADTEGFCADLALPVVNDPTNRTDSWWRTASGDPLRRAAVREWALPALGRALGQDAAPALARTARQLREDNEALESVAQRWLQENLDTAEKGGAAADVTNAMEIPAAVRRRVWRTLALRAGATPGEITEQQLRDIDELAVNWRGKGPTQLPGHVSASRDSQRLRFVRGNAVGE